MSKGRRGSGSNRGTRIRKLIRYNDVGKNAGYNNLRCGDSVRKRSINNVPVNKSQLRHVPIDLFIDRD